jgi:hypothetical protein
MKEWMKVSCQLGMVLISKFYNQGASQEKKKKKKNNYRKVT